MPDTLLATLKDRERDEAAPPLSKVAEMETDSWTSLGDASRGVLLTVRELEGAVDLAEVVVFAFFGLSFLGLIFLSFTTMPATRVDAHAEVDVEADVDLEGGLDAVTNAVGFNGGLVEITCSVDPDTDVSVSGFSRKVGHQSWHI